MKKFALIPAFEPDERLVSLCHALKSKAYDVVIVDDGSDIAYENIFNQVVEEAQLLSHVDNLGKGAAIKTGLNYICEVAETEDIVVTVDADGQHKIADIDKVVKAVEAEPDALVLGSRSFSGEVPMKRRIGNKITRAVYRAVARRDLADTQTGLRAFSYGLIPFLLEIPGDRYEYEMNVLLQCSQSGIAILEAPIETLYIDGEASSHFRAFGDAYRIYREIFKFAISSFAGFAIDYIMFAMLSQALRGIGIWAIPLANIMARVIREAVNFSANRSSVFYNAKYGFSSALRYGALATGMLAGNTLLLMALITFLGLNRYIAKLLTEAIFFWVGWQVRNRFVFKRTLNRER